jgi:uncharacterized membrane protein
MRIGIVVVGVVLLLIGAVLLFVPVVPQANQTVDTSSQLPFIAFQVSGYSLTGSIPISVSWTSPTAVEVFAAVCSGTCSNSSVGSSVSGVTLQSGTSGSFTLNQPNGGTVGIGALNSGGSGSSAPTVTFSIKTALSTLGTLLLIVGILLLILGVVLKSKKAPAMAPAPMPAAPPASAPDSGMPPSS